MTSVPTDVRKLLAPQNVEQFHNPEAIRICQTRLEDALKRLERLVAPDSVDRISALQTDLREFSVRISMVGQVKAGKTALTNALVGMPGILPSDVNPWTSVVTSVHINTDQPKGKDAIFTFFSSEEWDKMVDIGGHLGEMAMRANHREELEELRKQIISMQSRTKRRLGRNFELLLDGYHSFLGFTPEMVKKYVCLGEDDAESEGRYADVTKAADLYIKSDLYPLPTVLCDTPGVNDPFLLREAVTLENLTNTDICVIVLSAHQALSSVDIALLRILMAFKHDQLVLFINRIDELQNPDKQIAEIDGYVRQILEEQGLPKDFPIIFGSASWAEIVAADEVNEDAAATLESLRDYNAARTARSAQDTVVDLSADDIGTTANTISKTADLSGLHDLRTMLREKAAVGVARPRIDKIRAQALDIANQATLYLETASSKKSKLHADLDFEAFFDELDTILKSADDECTRIATELSDSVMLIVSNKFREFIFAEKSSLSAHLSRGKNINSWQPNTENLRRSLNIAHDKFVEHAPQQITELYTSVASQVEVIYTMVLEDNGTLFGVCAPVSPIPKTPTSLMRTMSIDMNSGWFASWFTSRFNQDSYLEKFDELCQAEMQTTLAEMQTIYITKFEKQVRARLYIFLGEHIKTLQNLAVLGGKTERVDVLRQLGVDAEIQHRLADLESVQEDLKRLFQRPKTSDTKPYGSAA